MWIIDRKNLRPVKRHLNDLRFAGGYPTYIPLEPGVRHSLRGYRQTRIGIVKEVRGRGHAR